MKAIRFLFAFLLFAGAASCSSDDDGGSNGPEPNDRIIGEWRVDQVFLDGEEVEIEDCEAQTRTTFLANGTVTSKEFFFDGEECVSEVYTEDWEFLGNNVYKFTDEDGDFYNLTINFSNNNNSFTISEETEEGSYSATYVRI